MTRVIDWILGIALVLLLMRLLFMMWFDDNLFLIKAFITYKVVKLFYEAGQKKASKSKKKSEWEG